MSFWSNVSVVMIARNADDVIASALASVPPGAEVIVADGGSADRTPELARAYGARVVAQDLEAVRAAAGNYDAARNGAMAAAGRPWIFVLDADERIPEALAAEIAALREPLPCAAFDVPRRNLFWGRAARLLGDDRQVRLVRAGHGRFAGHRLHRPMEVDGIVRPLAAPLQHENVRGWGDLARRWRRDVPLEAATAARPARWTAAAALPFHLFRHYYVRNQAWRDGAIGLRTSTLYALRGGIVAFRALRRRDRPGT